MTQFLVSPAEPPLVRALGRTSQLPERYGADVLWPQPRVKGLVGVQRKTYEDLLASVGDGRLQREIPQLNQCAMKILVVEGRPHWSEDGALIHRWLGRWTRDSYRSLLRSVQMQGIIVEHTDDLSDTVTHVEAIARWAAKGGHSSLARRPKPGPDRWGKRTNRATQMHVLQSVDGIGPGQAEAILDHFGGLPLEWTVREEELAAVRGVGPKTVARMVQFISPKKSEVPPPPFEVDHSGKG